jgi:hypothetical protein
VVLDDGVSVASDAAVVAKAVIQVVVAAVLVVVMVMVMVEVAVMAIMASAATAAAVVVVIVWRRASTCEQCTAEAQELMQREHSV